MKRVRKYLILVICLAAIKSMALSQDSRSDSSADAYQIGPRDLLAFSVLNEPDTANEQRIDAQGRIRVPYLGTMRVAGLTIRQAEHAIEQTYKEHDIYIKPQVTMRVIDYSLKEVAVLGEVNNPGKITFPIEANRLDIRNVISEAGGFTDIARSSKILVTRKVGGVDRIQEVDVREMLKGKSRRDSVFFVYPGDVVFVPERFF